MRVLVTGGRGWIGTETMGKLAEKGYEPVAYDLKDGRSIHDITTLRIWMASCDRVIHLAAIPHPLAGLKWEDYWKANVAGTQNVAEVAAELGITRMVYSSSTGYYGAQNGFQAAPLMMEESPNAVQQLYMMGAPDMTPYNEAALAYMVSKVMAESILAAYAFANRLPTVILRFAPVTRDGKPWGERGLLCKRSTAAEALTTAIDMPLNDIYEIYNIADEGPVSKQQWEGDINGTA